ncbi:DUF2059 domain-containing protein [Epibacterium ulvae]|uniref:DUF2059 domain-containing protein n=1 Tax=Epibacterium ulvae TaxID=1156985 RepID=UPI002490897A|nr:DUF2059 domain-containing protein [Epibacterium ulvae]
MQNVNAPKPAVRKLMQLLLLPILSLFLLTPQANAADRQRINTFLEITGFDVALDSIALNAESAPQILGLESSDFGARWSEITQDIFDTQVMRDIALDLLEKSLSDEALLHAEAFYGSALGQRLVAAENASHQIEDSTTTQIAGQRIIADLVREGAARVDLFKRMGRAVDSAETALTSLQEVQFRFIMAATDAGVIALELDADGLRALMTEQEDEMRLALQTSNLSASAYAYQAFSDTELAKYIDALETPLMQEVYTLLNAIQFEITANRFEALAYELAKVGQGEDI